MSEEVQAAEPAADVHLPATATAHPPATAEVAASPFTERQIDQFDADDGDAGRAIGKMLATFFLYTVIVMSLVAWWTFTR